MTVLPPVGYRKAKGRYGRQCRPNADAELFPITSASVHEISFVASAVGC